MRIAQVVTLVSPDGAYGGPVRVAVNQLAALKASGHDVTLFSTHRGYEAPPAEIDGVRLVSYKARTVIPKVGFAGLASPALMARLRRDLAGFDVVHVHLARDLVTLPAAWLALRMGLPLVVQTHGMIDRSANLLAAPLDAVLTRPVLRRADRTLYLTERERQDLREVSRGKACLTELPNGVPIPPEPLDACARTSIEVLFLARLQARKKPRIFVEAATRLAAEFPEVTFTLVGPDEGEGPAVEKQIADSGVLSIAWEGALDPGWTLERMGRSSIYVLPSVDEPFPMTVLEAASAGLPCVVTNTCGLAPAIERWQAGTVVDDSVERLAAAIRELLSDVGVRKQKSRNARAMVQGEFGIGAVARRLEDAYEEITPTATHKPRAQHGRSW